MFRLIRKVTLGAVIVGAGLMALSWAGLSSYPAAAFHKARAAAKKQVPLEFDIERLRYQVAQLVPDMKKHISSIAEMTVAVENLREDVSNTRVSLEKQQDRILTMTKELDSGATTVSYGGREWPASRLKEKLSSDFHTYQTSDMELKAKEQLLEAKERELNASRDQLSTLKAQKQELELEVARIEAELKTVRAVQAKSKYHIDNSSLSKCKATLAEIRNRLKIEKTASDLHQEFDYDAPASRTNNKSAKELSREIKSYFGHPQTDGSVAEKK
jgi:septal ring factor EnvC (AmiA/AmiB activator)